ncbi:Ribonuclease [Klebsiella spallanzanii]|nr:Ribonuclease [Klebsiella spallanzanii]
MSHGRMLSHAVLSGISAEIAGGDGKGAAAGALAAEIAGIVMQSSLFEPAYLNEKERQFALLKEAINGSEGKEQTARFFGALAGALVTHTPEGTYSGADSAQSVYRYNMTEHMLQQYALDNQRDILAASKGDKSAAKRVIARREAAVMAALAGAGGQVLTAGGMTLLGVAPEMVLAARLVIAGCKTNPVLCLNQAGIYAADIVAPEAVVSIGSGSVFFVGKDLVALKKLAHEVVKAADETLKNKVFNVVPVVDILKKEVAAGSALPKKTIDFFAAHNAANYAGLKMDLRTIEAANDIVDSLRNTGNLPYNYVDKAKAMANGWKPGKALNNSNPGKQIGGDIFQNSTNILPSAPGRIWREADVGINNTMSRSNQQGTRILYSNDGLLYVTTDHYTTVTSIGRWK